MKQLTRVCLWAVLVGVSAGITACTSPQTTTRVLEEQGYTHVKAGGYAYWMCGRDDTFATKFTATTPAGKQVEGAVCSAWLKGSTIRFK